MRSTRGDLEIIHCLEDRRAVVEPLIACLDDRECRERAARALAEIPDERALQPLLAALEDVMQANPGRRLGDVHDSLPIKWALEGIGGPEVEEAIRRYS
ncbi:MAG: hypothetical protein GYB65_03050 [Chloroflexi bacterium]|nr:hypothetical protein [Chloroflexota bacterium]